MDEQEWTGTRDYAAALATPAAIAFQREQQWDKVRAACHARAVEVCAQLTALTGLAPLSVPEAFAQMFAAALPPCDLDALKRRLYAEHGVEVPLVNWNGRQLLRVSIQGYNTRAETDRLILALEQLLPEVRQ